MGNIPLTSPQVGPGIGDVSPYAQDRVGGQGGRTLDRVGATAEDFLTRIAEQDAAIEGAGLLSKFRVASETAREQLQASVTTPDDFTKLALKQFDDMSKDFLGGIQNKRAARFVEGRISSARDQYAMDAVHWETGARAQRRALMVEDTLNQMGARVLKDPAEYDVALKEWDDAITASGVPIDVADKMRRNGSDQLAVSLAQGMIRRDPFSAIQAIQTDKRFTTLDPDKLEALIRGSESAIQHKAAMADHAAAMSERNRRLIGDQVAKEGFDLIAKGQMTEDWMTANQRVLDTSDYRMLRNGMQEGGGTSSAGALSDLYKRIYVDNVDASGEILSAMRLRTITTTEGQRLLNENQGATPVKRAKAYVTQYLQPTDANPDPAAKQRFAEAIAEFDRFFAEDPKQDPMDLASKIVERNAIINLQNTALVAPLPDHAVGGRTDFNSKATMAATTRAFMAKHGNDQAAVAADPAFKRELNKIKIWSDAIARQKAAAAQRAKGTK